VDFIKEGNASFRRRNYAKALEAYRGAYSQSGNNDIKKIVNFNILLAEKRLAEVGAARSRGTPVIASQGRIDIYMSCWLRNKESVQDGMISLYKKLVALGNNVKFITHSKSILGDLSVSSYNVSFDLIGTRLYSKAEPAIVPDEVEKDLLGVIRERLISINNIELSNDAGKLKETVGLSYGFWLYEFMEHQPSFVMVWGSTCPMSRLHIHLCKRLNIPYIVLERGHFSGTISADTLGQFAWGGSQLIPGYFDFSKSKYARIRGWLNSADELPYKHKNSKVSLSQELIDKKNERKGKVILFIGSNDVGSGVAYHDGQITERHSKLFHSSYDALMSVENALGVIEGGHLLVAKPHPADRNDYSQFSRRGGVVAVDENINKLIKAADVCVTLSTTAIAQCVLEEKPVVTLALSDFCGQGIAYECHHQSEVIAKLRSALSMNSFSGKVEKGRAFLQYLFEHRLFMVNDNEALFQSVSDLARRIDYHVSRYPHRGEMLREKSLILPRCLYREFECGGIGAVPETEWAPVDVVIPIYSDPNVTKIAIDTAISAIPDSESFRLVLINDASPDPGIRKLLEAYAGEKNVIVIENHENLGFSGTVNKAFELSENRDVILLNSDAVVTSRTFVKMRKGAYADGKIATLTPFSNNAGICSVPLKGGSLPPDDAVSHVALLDNKAAVANKDAVIEMPVGHGFCMYVRRSAINKIGVLDEGTFGRGYSEEVDFCLRARKLGYLNVAAPYIYVGHIGGVSFSDNANSMKIKNRKVIDNKYPGYFEEVKGFRRSDPLVALRNFISS